jgi:hypothetical protein
MNMRIFAGALGLGMFAMVGTANAISFTEAQNTTFEQYVSVTPNSNNSVVFSVSGLGSQFDGLSFSFVDVPGLSKVATQFVGDSAIVKASFNDVRSGAFSLAGNTAYLVKISGHTRATILGGVGNFSVDVINGAAVPVPEPESYAMLLAGLGLMGGIARRRMKADK